MPKSTHDALQLADKSQNSGKVYLVGAGPGDPRLITLRAKECLETADIVLFDGLANAEILSHAAGAECQSVGKHGESEIWTQERINQRLLELAAAGKKVVRLKGGDPAVFARSAEELEQLTQAKVPFEVVPGITAALAAASYVGIPITHRRYASAVAFITGQQQKGGTPQDIHWESLATFPGTLVFYMGVTTAEVWTKLLIDAGKSPSTPSAIIRRCTWQDQTVKRCSLGEVAAALTPASKMRPPVIVVVGEVANLGKEFDWFTKQPLHGLGVLSFRPDVDQELDRKLRELGAEVFHQPAIEIQPPSETTSLDRAIQLLADTNSKTHAITFSSPNGVSGFMSRLAEQGLDARVLAGKRIATVGPSTTAKLRNYGLRADIAPASGSHFSAKGLLEALPQDLASQSWIVITTPRNRGELQSGLQARGANVIEAFAYQSCDVTEFQTTVAHAIAKHRIGACIITSIAIANSAKNLLGTATKEIQPIAFSETIANHLQEINWPAAETVDEKSVNGMIQAIERFWSTRA